MSRQVKITLNVFLQLSCMIHKLGIIFSRSILHTEISCLQSVVVLTVKQLLEIRFQCLVALGVMLTEMLDHPEHMLLHHVRQELISIAEIEHQFIGSAILFHLLAQRTVFPEDLGNTPQRFPALLLIYWRFAAEGGTERIADAALEDRGKHLDLTLVILLCLFFFRRLRSK